MLRLLIFFCLLSTVPLNAVAFEIRSDASGQEPSGALANAKFVLNNTGLTPNAVLSPDSRLRPLPLENPVPATQFTMAFASPANGRAGLTAGRAIVDFDSEIPVIHLGTVAGAKSLSQGADGSTIITMRPTAALGRAIRSWPKSFYVFVGDLVKVR